MLKPVFGCLSAAVGLFVPAAQADQAIYTDSLQNSWANWSWSSTLNFNNPTPVHSGSSSIAVTITGAWGAFYTHHAPFDSTPYSHISFWIHGGTAGGQRLQLQAALNQVAQPGVAVPPLTANTWQQMTLSLSSLGAANKPNLDGFWLQDTTGAAQPTFYLDDISLVLLASATLTSPADGTIFTAPATINLVASANPNGHTINRMDFLSNGALLGSATAAPYTWAWTNVAGGSYSLTARLTYDGTNTVDSAAVNVLVATNSYVSIGVDAQLNRHPISPLIYGVAFASSNQLADLNAPLNRSGGNSTTRYNWQLNAHNTANDWYFESRAESSATPAASADDFVNTSKSAGAQPMLTIPMIGWTTKLGPGRANLPSFSVAKYGAQKAADPYWSDAGNGVSSSTSANITNDPNDASFPTNSAFQVPFVQHLTNRWGLSTGGGVGFYLMDNEESIWHSTHRDVHPVGATMQEIRDKFFDYAGVVKSVDPATLVLGPEEWGWLGYFYSGYDQQWAGAHNDWNPGHFPDRGTNAGWDYIPWLLDQFHRRATNTNQRLLDYCTAHVYPQGGEFGNDVTPAMQQKRNRSTRQLWDPNYVDPTWINSVVKLIPRLKSWVATYYPGTKIGITEYNWGAEANINGATAQADIYGIFGREGLDLGARWTTPDASTPTYKAMKMFRNYDGKNSGFGDMSIYAGGQNPDYVSTFAAMRAVDGAMTVVVINKQQLANAVTTISVTNQALGGTAQVWQLTSANVIQRLPDLGFSGNSFTVTAPPQSVTLLVISAAAISPPKLRAANMSSSSTFDFWLDGTAGQRYVVQVTGDFVSWLPVQTNTLSGNSWHVTLPATNAAHLFYRAQWLP